MGEIWFIRHGESLWNAEGRWQGQADPPLSARGRAQALALAETLGELARTPGAVLATSDLARARETAEILGAALGIRPVLDARFRELDVGCWSGHTPEEVGRRWPEDLARFRGGDLAFAPGGGESRLALRARVGAALADLVARGAGAVALVSHLGVVRAFRPGTVLAPGAWLRLPSLAEPEPSGHNPMSEPVAL
jgi:broad specificity phosphatase PhoE